MKYRQCEISYWTLATKKYIKINWCNPKKCLQKKKNIIVNIWLYILCTLFMLKNNYKLVLIIKKKTLLFKIKEGPLLLDRPRKHVTVHD